MNDIKVKFIYPDNMNFESKVIILNHTEYEALIDSNSINIEKNIFIIDKKIFDVEEDEVYVKILLK